MKNNESQTKTSESHLSRVYYKWRAMKCTLFHIWYDFVLRVFLTSKYTYVTSRSQTWQHLELGQINFINDAKKNFSCRYNLEPTNIFFQSKLCYRF